MISDEQGKKWLLQKLYDDGWRYCVMDKYENIYLTNQKPSMLNDTDGIMVSSCEKAIGITAINMIFPELNCNECISIAKELGIVDWSKVTVNAPIIVTTPYGDDVNMHFAKFKNGFIYYYSGGRTSWTQTTTTTTGVYKTTPERVRLAGDTDE